MRPQDAGALTALDPTPDNLAPRPRGTSEPSGAPLWYQYLVLLSGCGVLTFGGVGLLLADVGYYNAYLALPLGAFGTVAATYVARPLLPLRSRRCQHRKSASRGTPAALGAVIVGFGVAILNGAYAAHHVTIDSDPGFYAAAGRWLVGHRSLTVDVSPTWAHTGLPVQFGSYGMYQVGPAQLQFQGVHLLPALLAQAYALGGNALMFRTPAVLGTFGLWAIYLVGCQVIHRPWIVLSAVTALGVSLPQIYVSRDTFSESTTQVLLWMGIWLLVRCYRERRFGVATIAGLAIGGTLMTRIDAVVYLIPLPIVAATAWLATPQKTRRRMAGTLGFGLAGVLLASTLGTFDVQRRAGQYYDALRSEVHDLYGALLFSVVVAALMLLIWERGSSARQVLEARRRQVAICAGGLVGVALFAGWVIRPAVTTVTQAVASGAVAGLQQMEHVPINPYRTYAEDSLVWIGWYIGPVTLALAFGGLAALVSEMIGGLRRSSLRKVTVFTLLLMTGPLAAIYLWRPSIVPEQLWALRRFAPDTIPVFILAAASLLDDAVTLVARRTKGSWFFWAGLAGGVGMVTFSAGATIPIARYQTDANVLPAVLATCAAIGPKAAVVLPSTDIDQRVLTQTLRSWCGVPVAGITTPLQPAQVDKAESALRTEHKTLWVIGSTPQAITTAIPGSHPVLLASALSPREILPTIEKPVSHYESARGAIYGARVSSLSNVPTSPG